MNTLPYIDDLHTTKKDIIRETIREAIINGRLKPGQRLRQNDLANQLQVSPTPIREALKQLEQDGLVVYESHRGVRVADFDLQEAAELYRIRGALEALAVRLAIPNLDDAIFVKLAQLAQNMEVYTRKTNQVKLREVNREFHQVIYQCSGSRRLQRMLISLHQQIPWGYLGVVPGRHAQALQEHQALMGAMQRKDVELSVQLMQRHLENAARALEDLKATAPPIGPLALPGMIIGDHETLQ